MGRRHLILLVAAASAAALAVAAPAGAVVRWSELGRGRAELTQLVSPVTLVATDRDSALRFTSGLPQNGIDALLGVDYGRNLVVAVFGPFGCRDRRILVKSIVRKGVRLDVTLRTRPLAAGTKECRARYPTYRLLVLPKVQFDRPYPNRAETKVARA
jgi:hypothetical protein